MAACTFFGHRDTSEAIEPLLKETLIHLIEEENVDSFYVGNHGNFDKMVRKSLKRLKQEYPQIRYAVVLAYLPEKRAPDEDYSDTIYPEKLESIHPRYAIAERNRWMLCQSDYILVYIQHSFGSAAKYKAIAEKSGKIVLNLADLPEQANFPPA